MMARIVYFAWVREKIGTAEEELDIPSCLLYTSDAADDSLRVDLCGRRIIKKKKTHHKT